MGKFSKNRSRSSTHLVPNMPKPTLSYIMLYYIIPTKMSMFYVKFMVLNFTILSKSVSLFLFRALSPFSPIRRKNAPAGGRKNVMLSLSKHLRERTPCSHASSITMSANINVQLASHRYLQTRYARGRLTANSACFE